MKNSQQVLSSLCSIRRHDRELPGRHDLELIRLLEHYSTAAEPARDAIRWAVPDECRLLLLGFSDRLAILAERRADAHLLLMALLTHSIEDFNYDTRENAVRLALVHHVGEKLDAQPSEMFETAARLSSPRGAAFLREFDSRPPALKSLRAMGIVQVQTDDGIDYRPA